MKALWIVFSMVLLSACGDCVQDVSGQVVDTRTGLPVQGVTVVNIHREQWPVRTDSAGAFQLHAISGGLFNCPPMEIRLEKTGYETLQTSIPAGGHQVIRFRLQP